MLYNYSIAFDKFAVLFFMKTPLQFSFLFTLLFAVPVYGQNAMLLQSMIQFRAEVLSFLNVGVFITALISFKQFFFPGGNNTLPFQVFNIVLVGLFYGLGLPFLIANRAYYEGYEALMPIDVLGKFFLSAGFSSVAQWFIIASVIVNVLYIIRFRKDYYEAGIASAGENDKQNEDATMSPAIASSGNVQKEEIQSAAVVAAPEVAVDNNDIDANYRAVADNQFADVTEDTSH